MSIKLNNDFSDPFLWHLYLMNVQDAWNTLKNATQDKYTFGSPGVYVAVIDDGIESKLISGVEKSIHPDFSGNNKIYSFFNYEKYKANSGPSFFRTNRDVVDSFGHVMYNNGNGDPNSHGLAVSGALAGMGVNSSIGVGVAPNVSLFSFLKSIKVVSGNQTDPPRYYEYCALVGKRLTDPDPGIPGVNLYFTSLENDGKLPVVVSSSFDLGSASGNSYLRDKLTEVFKFARLSSRKNKGVSLFFSAGNEDELITPASKFFLTTEQLIVISSSTLFSDGKKEVRAGYSNFGPHVDFCTPSNSNPTAVNAYSFFHDPPTQYSAIVTSPRRNDIVDTIPFDICSPADTPASTGYKLKTTLAQASAIGDIEIVINSSDVGQIELGDAVLIGSLTEKVTNIPSTTTAESRTIIEIKPDQPSTGKTTIRFIKGEDIGGSDTPDTFYNNGTRSTYLFSRRLKKAHSAGSEVIIGKALYQTTFGGTSFSTPLASGIAALMLSANNLLTRDEIYGILKKTAVKIDLANTGFSTTGSGKVPGAGKWKTQKPTLQDRLTANDSYDIVNSTGDIILDSGYPEGTLTNTLVYRSVDLNYSGGAIFQEGQAIEISEGTNKELTTIRKIKSVGSLLVDPITGNFNPGATIKGGRKPLFSEWYGYGRLDANAAVKAALDYSPTDRNLNLKDYKDDTGERPFNLLINPIQSPSLWTRNQDDDTIELPHENPNNTTDRWIYIKVDNIGTKYASLPGATLRVYAALTDGSVPVDSTSTSPFYFPQNWEDNIAISTITSGARNVYFIEEVELPEIDPLGHYIAKVKWNQTDIPPVSTSNKIFIVAEVKPYDGKLSDPEPERNDNSTYREISFSTTSYLTADGSSSLPSTININSGTTNITQAFRIDIESLVGTYNADKIQIEVSRKATNNTIQTALFRKNGSSWIIDNTSASSWLSLNAPVVTSGSTTPSTGEVSTSSFSGSFTVSAQYKEITLKTSLYSSLSNVVISEEILTIPVQPAGSKPPYIPGGDNYPPIVNINAFTDFNLLPLQTNALAYGSISPTEYRVNSLFTGIASGGSQLKAYAATDGVAILTEVEGQADLVNLILKPDKQPNVNSSAVQYYIYKGLKKSSFLDSNGQILPKASATSDLLRRMWEVRENLNQTIADPKLASLPDDSKVKDTTASKATQIASAEPAGGEASKPAESYKAPEPGPSGPEAKQPQPLKRGDLGLPEVGENYATGTTLEQVFNSNTFQPVISGWYLGDFETGKNYGFEILVEAPNHSHLISDAKLYDHKITVTYQSGQNQFANNQEEDFTVKLQREKILSYIDAAAYFGLLYNNKVLLTQPAGGKSSWTQEEIYTNAISKYFTKNKLYIDIRNDRNNSLNLYGEYSDAADPRKSAKVQYNNASGILTAKEYHDGNGWPIMTLITTDIITVNNADKNKLTLSFPNGDNSLPIAYLSGASLFDEYPGEKVKFNTLTQGSGFTNTIDLGIPNAKSAGTIASSYIKLNYNKRYDTENLPTPVFPSTYPVKDDWIDNLLSPANVAIAKDYVVTFKGNSNVSQKMSITGSYTGESAGEFVVKIDSVSPAKLVWKKGNGNFSTPVTIASSEIALSDGIKVIFDNTTGLTAGDQWSFKIDISYSTYFRSVSDSVYIGWTSLKGEDYIVRSGKAIDAIGEVSYCYINGVTEVSGNTSYSTTRSSPSISKGSSYEKSFFDYLGNKLQLADISYWEISKAGGGIIKTIKTSPYSHYLSNEVDKKTTDDIFSIAYTNAEAETIQSLLAGFTSPYNTYFTALNKTALTDANGYLYFEFDLGLQGNKLISSNYQIDSVNTNIKLYSNNGIQFFTEAYAIAYNNILIPA